MTFRSIADRRLLTQNHIVMRSAPLALMAVLIGLVAGCAGVPEEMDRPDERYISSRISRGDAGELIVAVTYSGGGAGDTTHRLLACPRSARSCELLASIDTNDRPRPELIMEGSKITLLVNEPDYIGGFRSYSRALAGLEHGSIFLRYRESASPPG